MSERRSNQKDGKVKNIEVDGFTLHIQRKFFYCRAWDQFSASNYHCWKAGWVVLSNNRITVLSGAPQSTSCLGGTAPIYSTKKELMLDLEGEGEYYFNKSQFKAT